MGIIITETGQSIADLALQAYGTSTAQAMYTLIEDNPAVFTDGLASLVPAGMPVKVREDASFADGQLVGYFGGTVINSTYEPGALAPPDQEGEITPPDTPADENQLSIPIAQRGVWRIEIALAIKQALGIIGAKVVIVASGDTLENLFLAETYECTGIEETVRFATRYENDLILLDLIGTFSRVRYKVLNFI